MIGRRRGGGDSSRTRSSTSSSCSYGADYYERGVETGLSLYSNYRWIPELTIPLAATLCEQLSIHEGEVVLDYGCAKGYLVRALRLLHRQAYGIDVSDYAIANAPDEVRPYVAPLSQEEAPPWFGKEKRAPFFEWALAKDVLEHVPEKCLLRVLGWLRMSASNMWAAIPLGENGRYVVPAYELDRTHEIRRPLGWWSEQFEEAGWRVTSASYRMRHVKENWAKWEKGNGFFVCE